MIFRLISLVVLITMAVPQGTGAATYFNSDPHKETIRGYLIDLVCVREEAANLTELGPRHTKKCLQMPVCARSGYAVLLPSHDVRPFDDHGNELARKMISARNQEKSFAIKATGINQGTYFHVLRIE